MHRWIPDRGSTVWIRSRRWTVERTRVERNVMRIDVRDRENDRLTFLTPFDRASSIRPSGSAVRARTRSAAARLAGLCAARIGYSGLVSALDADLTVFGYQLEPALAVLAGTRRILIADEVGLGKTIQAGLVAAELRHRRGTLHALVLCPAALCRQWQSELTSRFSLDCAIAGTEAFAAVGAASPVGSTPWQRSGVWIASYDYVKQAHVLEGVPVSPWDLVVLDEAHEAAGATDRHAACDELARRSRHVLLLTATPHSGDSARFERLLAIGRHSGGRETVVVFRRTRAEATIRSTRRVRWHGVPPSVAESRLLDALTAYERTLLKQAGRRSRDAALLLLTLFRKRALSSAAALGKSLRRRFDWLGGSGSHWALEWLQPRLDFSDGDEMSDQDRSALMVEVGWAPAQERIWIRRLQTLAAAATGRETKFSRLAALVARTREPLIVFTEFRDSLEALRERVTNVRSVSVLHGGQSSAERRRELQRFLDGEASLLLTTDVGGQGLNLQSRARWVVSLELPWNPIRLEQRIGRVDRIGQVRSVHGTVLVTRHSGEDGLLRALARRALAARRALGDDVLADVAFPGESTIARALIAAEPLPPGQAAPPSVPISTRWRRPAAALARVLMARRTCSHRWRGRQVRGRARWCTWRGSDRGSIRGAAAAVFSVPLVDAGGAELERHVLVLGGWTGRPSTAVLAAVARRVAGARLAARRRRLDRLVSAAAAAAAAHECAVGAHLHAVRYPEQAQPGLFTRGAVRSFETARDEAQRIRATTRHRARQLLRSGPVSIGEPVLELLFLPRP